MPRKSAILALILGVLAPLPARAGTLAVADALTVEGPACLDRTELAGELVRRLGRDRLDDRFRVVVRPLSTGGGAAFSIIRGDRSLGERRLEGEVDCPKLGRALAVAIAVALDAAALEAPPPPAEPAGPGLPQVTPTPVAPMPERDAYRRLSLGASGMLLVDVLPVTVVGGSAWVMVRPLPSLALRGSFLVTDEGTVAIGAGGSYANLLAGRLDACFVFGRGLLTGGLCGGAAVGQVRAQGFGESTILKVDSPWVAAVLRADAQLHVLPWFGVVLGVEGVVPVVSPRYEVTVPGGAAQTQPTPVLGVAADLGVAFSFL